MELFVLTLSDSKANLETVGGKGMSLAKMANAGFPVPGGFHVTTAVYRAFVKANELQQKIITALRTVDPNLPATLESTSTSIRELFTQGEIPPEIKEAILGAYEASGSSKKSVAVRSSATAEDLPEASFAGQQETYLNICSEEALLEAVKKCWASLWTARAIAYRIKNNIDQNTIALAVVVQEMVNAEAAGILFTANPMNGKRDEVVINAAWGLGEAIVGGLVSPDMIVAEKATGKVKQMDVAEKTVITVTTVAGTEEKPLNEARRKSQVLKEAQISELVGMASRIEEFFGKPQDIEWCHANDRFYIVQSRPITTLSEEATITEWPRPNSKAMYARGSLAEHLPNAVSPLFGTLGLRAVNKSTAELGDVMNMDLLEAEYQYRVVNGYVYMGFLMNARFMWSMVKLSFTGLKYMLSQGTERWHEAQAVFVNVIAAWVRKQVGSLSPSELLEGVLAVMCAAGKYYTVIQAGTLPTASTSEIIFTRVYKMVSRKGEPDAPTMLFGLETVPLRAEKSLFDLGKWIRERPALRNYTLHATTDELVAALKADSTPEAITANDWDELKSRFEKHLDEFGRTSYEYDFMNPTPAETPGTILEAVKMYVEGRGNDPYVRQHESVEKREQTVQKIRNRFKLIPNRWFNKALKWAMDSGPAREDSIANMGMGHTVVRRMLGELGTRFAVNGAIENADDIYWLVEDEVNELASMLERSEKLPDYSSKVPARKTEWRKQMKLVAPPMLPTTSRWAKMIPWNKENVSGNVIKGLGASAGKVTAPACVLFGPEDFYRMKQGSVLVAVTTTPAWTPLFTMASAVVTDIGGPLSHSSIVAREYGIPAVLATGIGTRRIKDGQTLTVDGAEGKVYLKAGGTPTGGPSIEWKLPNPKGQYMRGSIVDMMPDPLSPLFATLGIPAIARVGMKQVMKPLTRSEPDLPDDYILTINDYAYMGATFTPRQWWWILTKMLFAFPRIIREALPLWRDEIRPRYVASVERWQARSLEKLTLAELWTGIQEVNDAAMVHLASLMVATTGSSAGSEMLFARVYEKMVKRQGDPAAVTFLMGYNSTPIQAEKSLYDLASWCRELDDLAAYIKQTPADQLAAQLTGAPHSAGEVVVNDWPEFQTRFQAHLKAYGHIMYDLDFAKLLPLDDPTPMLEMVKMYLRGEGANPHERQSAAEEKRVQAAEAMLNRLRGLRRWAFRKTLGMAQTMAQVRENALADIGLGYPILRQMLRELGRHFVQFGIITQSEDIFWLEAGEVCEAIAALERGESPANLTERVARRKTSHAELKHITPPPMLPPKKKYMGFDMETFTPAAAESQTGNTLKGVAASAGKITAPACVLHGPEDFDQMRPGTVLVAGTTTPAWTPLFAMASAVVTNIGGPLSHGSIVAREYGIPAVMGTGIATKCIKSGQMITVDGSTGTVTLGSM